MINLYLKSTTILKLAFCGLLMCGAGSGAFAFQQPGGSQVPATQPVKVTGVVMDEKGNKIPGVTIFIQGTTRVSGTDDNGKFSLEVHPGAVLQFSYVGMKAQQKKIEGAQILNVILKTDEAQLGEVVVTGYNQTTTKRTTGSVAVLKADDLKGSPLKNIDQLLQGKVAGVSVMAVSGRPGESAKVRIRGTNTISGNAEPLWVVDGVPLQKDIPKISSSQVKTGDFNTLFTDGISGINPNDIESVTILKDASAAAIYGSRAAGGVIVVTTKRGVAGKMKVNYSTNFSAVMRPQRDGNLMNSREKLAWEQELWDEFSAKGFGSGGYYPTVGVVGMIRSGKGDFANMSKAEQDAYIDELGKTSTDWFGELFQNSLSQNHYLSLSGGKESHTYYLSFGYSNNNGLVKNTDFNRYNVSSKFNIKANERLSIGFISDLSFQTSNGPSMNTDPFKYAYFANPYEKPYNADGSYTKDQTYFNLKKINGGYDVSLPPSGFNIMREMNETSSQAKNFSGTATMDLTYRISNNFRFSGLASYSYTHNQTDNINGKSSYAAFQDRLFFDQFPSTRTYGSITQSSANNSSYTMRGQLMYDKDINSLHHISALAGSEIRGQYAKSVFAKRYGYDPLSGNASLPIPPQPDGDGKLNYDQFIAFANAVDGMAGQSIVEDAFASFYGSVDYSYNRKYIASFTTRTDGSNNFGNDQQFNPAWSVGLSWNVDQEPFMLPLQRVLSSLIVRVATGYTGNINKSVYPQLVMNYEQGFRKTYEDFYRMGRIQNAPNRDLRWEKTRDLKAAVDFGLFKDRIKGLVEVYTRTSKDLVTGVRVPSTTGFTEQKYNTSEVTNNGMEVTLSSLNIKTRDFSWRTSVNAAYNQNKLTRYVSPTGMIYGNNYVNYPLGAVFSGKLIGVDAETGIYRYQLRPDSDIKDEKDLRQADNYLFFLGTNNAPVTGGFSTGVTYKTWSLSVGGSYALGGKIVNKLLSPANSGVLERSGGEPIPTTYNDLYTNHLNVNRDRVNRWTANNPRTDGYPRIIDAYGERLYLDRINPTTSSITDVALLENVSYLRINSVALSYSLHPQLVKRMKLESVGFSCSVNNLFTFTNYSGIDPETPGAVYPISRSVSFGLSVGF